MHQPFSNFNTNHILSENTTYLMTHKIDKSNSQETVKFEPKSGSHYSYSNSGTITDLDNDGTVSIYFLGYGNGVSTKMLVGDLIVINSVSASDITTVETYLKSKYGF